MFISPASKLGLNVNEGNQSSLTYLYGLSDFWVSIFEDTELVDGILETSTVQLGDVYSRFLQLAGNISLDTIQETYNTQIKLIRLSHEDSPEPGLSVRFKLPAGVENVKYLMNRPLLPTLTLERDVHFEIVEGELRLFRPLFELAFPKRPTKQGVEEYAIWATDYEVNEGQLESLFGYLVDMTPEKSIGRYKDFLKGLYFLYGHGPNIQYIEQGLNLALGLPYARQTEKVLSVIQDRVNGHWIVVTASQYYDIPYGFRPDIEVGNIIQAGQQLASWIEVRDYQKDGDWWINSFIPKQLLNNVSLPPAVPGNVTDRLMRTHLKNHTFQVLFKQAGVSLDAYQTVREIVDRVKPSYTFPIFVWQAPVGDEVINIDDQFSYMLDVSIDDTLGQGLPIELFVRNNPQTEFYRGKHWYNRFQVPMSVKARLGDDSDKDDIGVNQDGLVRSGIGGWVPEFQFVEELDRARMAPMFRTRGDNVISRTRSTAIRGRRGDTNESFEDMEWTVPAKFCYPASSGVTFKEKQLVPLYAATASEVLEKFKKAYISFDLEGAKAKVVRNVPLKSLWDVVMKRTDHASTPGTGFNHPSLEEVFDFQQSSLGLDPLLSRYALQMYVPPRQAFGDTVDLFVAEIFRHVWAVYVIERAVKVRPTYFPVARVDEIDLVIEFDYNKLTYPLNYRPIFDSGSTEAIMAEEVDLDGYRPSLLNRSTINLEPSFMMSRDNENGAYQDRDRGYILNINRSGVYGDLDKPLKIYKKV